MNERDETSAYPFQCPWCEYEFRKERYFGPHVFRDHPNEVVKDGVDPDEVIWDDWK